MSSVGSRLIAWQGGEHEFCIAAVGNIMALEGACKSGMGSVYGRLIDGTWWLNDIRETIRLGLIGGGMTPAEAMDIVKANVDANPKGFAPSVLVAIAILEAALVGVPDDPVGKTTAADAETGLHSSTTMAASAAPPSSESVQA